MPGSTQYNNYQSGWLPQVVTLGTGDSDTMTFDTNTGRTTQYKATINSSSATGSLTWNSNGSLGQLQISDPFNSANSQTCTYARGDVSRISKVDCGSGNWGQTFSYDAFGNITKTQTESKGTSFAPGYSSTTNQMLCTGCYYDANGNLTQDGTGGNKYTWDAEGKLSTFNGGTALVYDALGRRVEQTNASGTREILYGPSGSKLALMSGQAVAQAFIGLSGGATAVYSGSTLGWYRHPDWLGSSRIASTPSRTVYYDGEASYSPFGESPTETGNIDHNFTGQNQDLTSILYDFPAREHHPGEGRWISPDPAGSAAADPTAPQSWNRYAYVANSPLNLVDPYGLNSCPLLSMTCNTEEVAHIPNPAGVYNSLTFTTTMLATMLGVQTLGFSSPSLGSEMGLAIWVPVYNDDGSLASLDRIDSETWTDPGDQGSGLTLGVGLAGNADIGAIIAGAEANTTVAGTLTLNGHPSLGAFVSGSAVAYAGQHVAAIPQQLTTPTVLGAYAGDGVTFLASNVGGVAQMLGPFQMWCGNVGFLVAGSSCVSADTGGHFVFQITFGWGVGLSGFSVTTNTPSCSGPGC